MVYSKKYRANPIPGVEQIIQKTIHQIRTVFTKYEFPSVLASGVFATARMENSKAGPMKKVNAA